MKSEKLVHDIFVLSRRSETRTVKEEVEKIKKMFPEEKYIWEKNYKADTTYVVNHEIIYLTPQLTLTISYPEGDRLGCAYAMPGIDIYFKHPDPKLQEVDLTLFQESKYNAKNEILSHVYELVSEYQMSEKEIIDVIDHTMEIPLAFLNSLTEEQLQNEEIQGAIIEMLKRVADWMAYLAYDQYQYGQYGGEDVSDWELSLSSQYEYICRLLPEKIKMLYKDSLKREWLMMPETKKNLEKEEKQLSGLLDVFRQQVSNYDRYCNEIRGRYYLLQNYEEFFEILQKENFYIDVERKIASLEYEFKYNIEDKLVDSYYEESERLSEEISGKKERINSLENKIDDVRREKDFLKERFQFVLLLYVRRVTAKQLKEAKDEIAKLEEKISWEIDILKKIEEIKKQALRFRDAVKFVRDISETEVPMFFSEWSDMNLIDESEVMLNKHSKDELLSLLQNRVEERSKDILDVEQKLKQVREKLAEIRKIS